MITKEELKQLQTIAKANDWPIIDEVGALSGKPVYRLRHPNVIGKVGYPHLYMFNGSKVVELEHRDVVAVIKQPSFQSGGNRIKYLGSDK